MNLAKHGPNFLESKCDYPRLLSGVRSEDNPNTIVICFIRTQPSAISGVLEQIVKNSISSISTHCSKSISKGHPITCITPETVKCTLLLPQHLLLGKSGPGRFLRQINVCVCSRHAIAKLVNSDLAISSNSSMIVCLLAISFLW